MLKNMPTTVRITYVMWLAGNAVALYLGLSSGSLEAFAAAWVAVQIIAGFILMIYEVIND